MTKGNSVRNILPLNALVNSPLLNSHQVNSHLESSHPLKFPPGEFLHVIFICYMICMLVENRIFHGSCLCFWKQPKSGVKSLMMKKSLRYSCEAGDLQLY